MDMVEEIVVEREEEKEDIVQDNWPNIYLYFNHIDQFKTISTTYTSYILITDIYPMFWVLMNQ